MTSEISATQKTYIYTQCDKCGRSCNGPKVKINQGPRDPHLNIKMETAILFPAPNEGYLSDRDGLTITSLSGRLYTLNENGAFHITFTEGREPQITPKTHECSSSSQGERLSRDEDSALSRQEQRSRTMDARLARFQAASLSSGSSKEISSVDETSSANPKSSVAQIESADLKQSEDVYVGTCVHSGEGKNSFTYGGKSAKNVSSSMNITSSTTTVELLDGRTLHIQVKKKGIFINGTLRESRIGTFKLHVLPGDDHFLFVQT